MNQNKPFTATNGIHYGKTITYPFTIDKECLDELCLKFNRGSGQTLFLFQLVGGDYEKLVLLEEHIKIYSIGYCPDNTEEVEEILLMNSVNKVR